jgi:hypothetical protein
VEQGGRHDEHPFGLDVRHRESFRLRDATSTLEAI